MFNCIKCVPLLDIMDEKKKDEKKKDERKKDEQKRAEMGAQILSRLEIKDDTILNSATGNYVKLIGATGSQILYNRLYCNERKQLTEAAFIARGGKAEDTLVAFGKKRLCRLGHVTPRDFYHPRTCSVCTSSVWEKIIYAIVQCVGLDCEKHHIMGKAELDIFIPSVNKAIEYNGKQHYFKGFFTPDLTHRILVDQRKFELCVRHGIKLLFLPYDDPRPVETLMKFLTE